MFDPYVINPLVRIFSTSGTRLSFRHF